MHISVNSSPSVLTSTFQSGPLFKNVFNEHSTMTLFTGNCNTPALPVPTSHRARLIWSSRCSSLWMVGTHSRESCAEMLLPTLALEVMKKAQNQWLDHPVNWKTWGRWLVTTMLIGTELTAGRKQCWKRRWLLSQTWWVMNHLLPAI